MTPMRKENQGCNRWATDGLILPAWYYPHNRLVWNQRYQTYPVPSRIASEISFPNQIHFMFHHWGSQLHYPQPQDTSLNIRGLATPKKSWQGSVTKTYKLLVSRVNFGLNKSARLVCWITRISDRSSTSAEDAYGEVKLHPATRHRTRNFEIWSRNRLSRPEGFALFFFPKKNGQVVAKPAWSQESRATTAKAEGGFQRRSQRFHITERPFSEPIALHSL